MTTARPKQEWGLYRLGSGGTFRLCDWNAATRPRTMQTPAAA